MRGGATVLVGCLLAGLAVAAPSAAALRVARTAVLPTPPGVCGGIADPSTPTLDADPTGRTITSWLLLRGGDAASLARSEDGGRTFTASALPGASACSGGGEDHVFLANPRGALGPDGRAWFGSSWGGSSNGLFAFGVEVFAAGAGVARPAGAAQDVSVVPDREGGNARILWQSFDQIPNPATYLPTRTPLLSARVTPGGALGESVTVIEPPPGSLYDDSRMLRTTDGTLVVTASQASYADLVTSLSGGPVQFAGISARSTDDGATWTPGGSTGTPRIAEVSRDGITTLCCIGDVAAGDGRVVRVYSAATDDGMGRIELVTSRDGGATWTAPRTVVTVPVVALFPSVAVLPKGRVALSWYDARGDTAGDGRFDIRPWAAIVDPETGGREEVALGPAFDLGPMLAPGYPVDSSALGVTQDIVTLPAGFGTAHTEPAAKPGVTRVVYSRLSTKPAALPRAVKKAARRRSPARRPRVSAASPSR